MRSVIYPVKDLEAAKAVFGTALAVAPVMDAPYYVQYSVDGLDIGLDPNGHKQGMTGPVCFWKVDDIGVSFKQLIDAGAEEQRAIQDVGGGRLVAVVTDADGNGIGLMQDT